MCEPASWDVLDALERKTVEEAKQRQEDREEITRLRRRVSELTAALRPFADRTAGLEHWAAAERLLSEGK